MFSSQFWDIWDIWDEDDAPLSVCWEGVKPTIAPYSPPWNARGCVDIWDGQLHVNGQPITVAGANVHEMHPLRGKAITEEDMLLDIKKLMLDCTGGMRLNEQKELIIHCNSGMADASQAVTWLLGLLSHAQTKKWRTTPYLISSRFGRLRSSKCAWSVTDKTMCHRGLFNSASPQEGGKLQCSEKLTLPASSTVV
jgi:hypothetical protein